MTRAVDLAEIAETADGWCVSLVSGCRLLFDSREDAEQALRDIAVGDANGYLIDYDHATMVAAVVGHEVVGRYATISEARREAPTADLWLTDVIGDLAECLRPHEMTERPECYERWPASIWGA